MNNFIGFFITIIYSFIYNDLSWLFKYSELFVLGWNNYILTWIVFVIILLLIDILLMYLWNKLYKKKNYKFNTNNFMLFIYTYIFRFIPILCHIWSFLAWMNKNNIKKHLLFLVSWFLFHIIMWYYFLEKIDFLKIFFIDNNLTNNYEFIL